MREYDDLAGPCPFCSEPVCLLVRLQILHTASSVVSLLSAGKTADTVVFLLSAGKTADTVVSLLSAGKTTDTTHSR